MRFYNLFLLFIFLNFSCTTNSVNDDFSNEISLNEAKTNGLHIVIEEAGFKKIVDLRNKYVHKKIFNEKLYSKALLILPATDKLEVLVLDVPLLLPEPSSVTTVLAASSLHL